MPSLTHVPEKFPFPYAQPYDIQHDFMTALYSTLSEKKIGIFESPTGTGKTLSIICGAFKWLQDHRDTYLIEGADDRPRTEVKQETKPNLSPAQVSEKGNAPSNPLQAISSSKKPNKSLPSWVSKQFEKQKITASLNLQEEHTKKLKEYEEELELLRLTKNKRFQQKTGSNFSNLLDDPEDNKPPERLKIIFASRTHSQLSQFLTELKKSPYAGQIACVTLASRNSLCINEEVKNLGNSNAINEACLELNNKGSCNDLQAEEVELVAETKAEISISEPAKKRQKTSPIAKKASKTTKSSAGCPFHKFTKELNLRHEIMSKNITDLEDLIQAGKTKFQACPYYVSRRSISNAELVLVPYNILLNKNLREKSGLNLRGTLSSHNFSRR